MENVFIWSIIHVVQRMNQIEWLWKKGHNLVIFTAQTFSWIFVYITVGTVMSIEYIKCYLVYNLVPYWQFGNHIFSVNSNLIPVSNNVCVLRSIFHIRSCIFIRLQLRTSVEHTIYINSAL